MTGCIDSVSGRCVMKSLRFTSSRIDDLDKSQLAVLPGQGMKSCSLRQLEISICLRSSHE